MTIVAAPVSPAELCMIFLNERLDRAIVAGGAVVGPASDAEQQAGCVQITDAGSSRPERYVPLYWSRVQLRCVAATEEQADRIAYHLVSLLRDQGRQVIVAHSTGVAWLVHAINLVAGPSQHYDGPESREDLVFAELVVGLDPVT